MRNTLKRIILTGLLAADGMPLPESALISAVKITAPERPTDGDVFEALKDVEAKGYVSGLTDDIAGRTWSLTDAGKHKARQLQ
ncbi:MAG: hypothetical protein KGL39_17730 [Patescibacteria group bacterium]|nr:hypothetical protein [Patescibacteria group bacterium]